MMSRIGRWIGIQRDRESAYGVRLRLRFWLFAAVGLAVLFGFGMVEYSESPQFCHSCHIMDPYYESWEASVHAGVDCVECHYPPGSTGKIMWKKVQAVNQVVQYVTDTYSSRPFAEVSDASCLRSGCHATNLLEGRVDTEAGIHFDHRIHLSDTTIGRELRCVSCHSQITVGEHIELDYSTCYLCHFKGHTEGRVLEPVGGCLGCHTLPTESFQVGNMTYDHADFVSERGVACSNCHLGVVSGSGEASRERCLPCHAQEEDLARYGETEFLHQSHVAEHNVDCFHCHQEIRHGLGSPASRVVRKLNEPAPLDERSREAEATPDDAIHRATLTFDCALCHQDKHGGQLLMYSGQTKALGLPEMPSPMYLADVDCVACHYAENGGRPGGEFRGFTYEASQDACIKCHGPEFEGIWEETEEAFASTLERLRVKLVAVSGALEQMESPPDNVDALRASLTQARRWHDFVRYSRGEHNVYLGSVALRKANDLLDGVGEELDASLPDLSGMPLISGAYCADMCHVRVGVEVPPAEVMSEAFGSMMPHGMHAEMMSCVRCHEIGAHKEVPMREGVFEVCSECH